MFFDVLKNELDRRDLTLNKLAKGAGIAQSATDRWKHGSVPNAEALIKICKYLNVSSDYLLELEPDPPDRLTPDEEFLIECYRSADQEGKELIFQIVKREASRNNPSQKESYDSKIG